MNILIVGNGFDLSHYLPTKYDHFMDVMSEIEGKNTGGKVPDLTIHTVKEWMDLLDDMFERKKDEPPLNYQMNFDELFSKTRDPNFIEKTKEFYLTDSILLSAQDVIKAQYRLSLNCWYQYFKNHVEEIKTWIDFEQKIDECLQVVNNLFEINNKNYEKQGWQNLAIRHDRKNEESFMFLSKKNCEILNFFGLVQNLHDLEQDADFSQYSDLGASYVINKCYLYSNDANHNLNYQDIIHKLYLELEEFIDIFNFYLIEIVDNFIPVEQLEIVHSDFDFINKIYSFNYTNTYEKFYGKTKDIEFLHGSSGETQNIVLGISELHAESLKKLKAYGFTKYHQKLLKQTDYLFLDDSTDLVQEICSSSNYLDSGTPFNFYIWGHSLDSSDEQYIRELFSFNKGSDQNVRVIILYFNKQANFELLANLLHVLGKEKVETWMKKGWLKFEKNPNIVKLNNIQSVELPKIAEA